MDDNTEALPPLPEPAIVPLATAWPYKPHYTADQMRAYARAALAQRQQVPASARVAEVRVPRPHIAQFFVHGVLVRSTHDGQNGFDVLAALASEVNSAALTAAPSAQAEPAAPKGCYPEEWGPSSDRRLTCACGNPDPSHWQNFNAAPPSAQAQLQEQ